MYIFLNFLLSKLCLLIILYDRFWFCFLNLVNNYQHFYPQDFANASEGTYVRAPLSHLVSWTIFHLSYPKTFSNVDLRWNIAR